MAFPDELRAARVAAGISQGQAAISVGAALGIAVTAGRISEWERGERTPKPERQRVILDAIRVPAAVTTPHPAAPAPPIPGKAGGVPADPGAQRGAFWALALMHRAIADAYEQLAAAGAPAQPAGGVPYAVHRSPDARAVHERPQPELVPVEDLEALEAIHTQQAQDARPATRRRRA